MGAGARPGGVALLYRKRAQISSAACGGWLCPAQPRFAGAPSCLQAQCTPKRPVAATNYPAKVGCAAVYSAQTPPKSAGIAKKWLLGNIVLYVQIRYNGISLFSVLLYIPPAVAARMEKANMKKKSRLQSRFCWMYALYFGGYMSFFSFYGVLLRQHGAGAASLGVLSAGTAAANLLSLVVSGHLADRMRASKKILLVSGGLSAVWGLFLLGAIPSLAATWAVIIPVSCFDYALIGMLDAMTNTAARSGAGVQYSSARAWGALSGAVISMGLGQLLHRIGTEQIVWFHLAFYVALLVVAYRLHPVGEPVLQKQSRPEKGKIFPGYGRFVMAVLLLFLGWRALMTYLPSMVVDFGGDSRQQGWIMAELSFCSMAGLWLYPKLRRYAGAKLFLLVGALCMVIRLAAMAFLSSLMPLALVQGLELVSYGLFQPAAMEYISTRVSSGQRATALSLYTALQMPAGTILANAIAVPVLQVGNTREMFGIFALLALAGLLLLAVQMKESKQVEGMDHA